MRLIDMSAEEMLESLEEAQKATIRAEQRYMLAKARLTAVEGAVIDELKRQGLSVEVSKRLMWDQEALKSAHREYLKIWGAWQAAKAEQMLARDQMEMWRTVRADARRV